MAKARRPSTESVAPYVGENLSALRQYTLSVSGTSSWVTSYAVGVPYQTLDGQWRIRINIEGTSSINTPVDLTITGVVFKTTGSVGQALAVWSNGAAGNYGRANSGANTIRMLCTANSTQWGVTGDVALDDKPSFVP